MPPPMRRRILSRVDIERALFVDYEGNTARPPTLLGWRIKGRNFGAIVEPSFDVCAGRYRVRSVSAVDHASKVAELIRLAQEDDCLIVSWSEHDLKHMRNVTGEDLRGVLEARYRNALRTVRAWHGRRHGIAIPDASLSEVAHLLGIHVPQRYGVGLVGDALRLIREQLNQGRSWPELTPAARSGWVTVVKHNRYDLQAMQEVLQVITADPVFTTAAAQGLG